MTSSRVGPALLLGAFGVISVLALPYAAASQLAPRFIRSQLTWFNREGKKLSVVGSLADYGNLELSPDGDRVAVAVLSDPGRGTRALWIVDVATGRHTAFTSEAFDENWMIWSRDGRRVVFNSGRDGGLDLYEAAAAAAPGARAGDALLVDREAKWPVSWSSDGRYLLYVVASRGANHILALPFFGDRKPIPFGHPEDSENWAAFSPDGKWVAYSSTESGGAEVYLAAFPPAAGGRAWRVSSGGGTQARWRRDGKELYYMSADRRIMAVSIEARGADLDIGPERALFQVAYPYGQYHAFDVTADGQRFLVNALVTTAAVPSNAH